MANCEGLVGYGAHEAFPKKRSTINLSQRTKAGGNHDRAADNKEPTQYLWPALYQALF